MCPYFSVSGEAGEKKWHKIQCIIAALRLLYYACAYRVNSHLSWKRLCPVAAAVLRSLAAMAGMGREGTSLYSSPPLPPAMTGADFFLSPLAEI